MGVITFYCKGETDAYSHELSLDGSNVHCLDLELLDNVIIFPNVGSGYCYI